MEEPSLRRIVEAVMERERIQTVIQEEALSDWFMTKAELMVVEENGPRGDQGMRWKPLLG